MGIEVSALKKAVTQEISRGIATGLGYGDIARNIANATSAPFSRTKTIARTEGHRIQQTSTADAQRAAKEQGADVVKQWDATLDGKTRESHRRVDGEIRELDEKFSNGLMYPGDPNGAAAEVINCRCACLTRARWALDEEELEELKQRAEFFGLDKTENFEKFRRMYMGVTSEWVSADAKVKELLNADARDNFSKIIVRETTKIKQGFSAFPKNDILYERIKRIEPDGNKFDVALHGSPKAVAFGSTEANMSPRLLASIIRHSEGYHGQEIRLISCSTGRVMDGGYCFAEELANALGVTVYAPNDLIFISRDGRMSIGRCGSGKDEVR